MKQPIKITVEKTVLIAARQKAMGQETVVSNIIEGFLSLWIEGKIDDPDAIRAAEEVKV